MQKFQFKVAYTPNMREYDFPLDTTIRELINKTMKHAYKDFGIVSDAYPVIKVVESGQYNNANGYDPELAPALEPSDETLKDRYEGRYDKIGFFIRYYRA